MPFGHTNAPVMFQCLMESTLLGLVGDQFQLLTDHKPLTTFKTLKDTRGHLTH